MVNRHLLLVVSVCSIALLTADGMGAEALPLPVPTPSLTRISTPAGNAEKRFLSGFYLDDQHPYFCR